MRNIEVNYQIYINYKIYFSFISFDIHILFIYGSLVLSTTIHQTREPNIRLSKEILQNKRNHLDFLKMKKNQTDLVQWNLVTI